VTTPGLDDDDGFSAAAKPFEAEARVAQRAVDALVRSVLPRFPGSMKALQIFSSTIQLRTALLTNSAPLLQAATSFTMCFRARAKCLDGEAGFNCIHSRSLVVRPGRVTLPHPLQQRLGRAASFSATDTMAAHCDSWLPCCSNTSRMALSRISAGYLLCRPIAPILARLEASGELGRFSAMF
jgi:hypothetical protein